MLDTKAISQIPGARLADWIIDHAIRGTPPLIGGPVLAYQYMIDLSYPDNHARAEALVREEASRSFSAGFLAGVARLIRPPEEAPPDLVAQWLIQARLAAAVALVYGHNLKGHRPRALMLLALAGENVDATLEEVGIQRGTFTLEEATIDLGDATLDRLRITMGGHLLRQADLRNAEEMTRCEGMGGGVRVRTINMMPCYAAGWNAMELFRHDGAVAIGSDGLLAQTWEPPS